MNVDTIMNDLVKKHPGEVEYHQAVREVLESIEEIYNENPHFRSAHIVDRIIEPDRLIVFKVPWADDQGTVHVNLGYRIQFNNAIGPYKGGLRFHPSVNLSILKFLGFSERMTWIATPFAVIIILLALQVTSATSWKVRIKDFGPMSLECILLAVPLIVLSLAVNRSVSSNQQSAYDSSREINVKTAALYLSADTTTDEYPAIEQSNDRSSNPLLVDFVTGIGAGIYEEFVFRLILICLLMLIFQDIIGINWQSAVFLSVLIAAILFSVHHHVYFVNGNFQTGEPFSFSGFIFRTLAGIYFAIVFAVRGFGITAGTHAFYNLIAAALNAYVLN